MKKVMLCIGMLAVLLALPAAAEEFKIELISTEQAEGSEPAVPCEGNPDLAAVFGTPAPVALYTASSGSACCSTYGCCTHIESGCETCSGGRRWYSVYRCGTTNLACRVSPTACPTAC